VPNWSVSRNYKENWNSTNISHPRNAPDTRRQCAKATIKWAQRAAGRPNSLAGQPNFVASHGLASWARFPGSGNKESKARSQWKPDSVAAQPHG
jgi:hypothetical protein